MQGAAHAAAAAWRSIVTRIAWATNALDATARASAGDRERRVREQGVRWTSRTGWECASVTISISRKAEGGEEKGGGVDEGTNAGTIVILHGERTGHGGYG